MSFKILRWLAIIGVAILVLSESFTARPTYSSNNPTTWFTFVPADEEFTVDVPSPPTYRVYPLGSYYGNTSEQERVLAHREYGGYGDSLVFIIHSFKAARPQKLSATTLNLIDKNAAFERERSFDGITAKQYRTLKSNRTGTYTQRTVRFTTDNHVYLITLMTMDETNPAVEHFLSSVRLRRPDDRITAIPQRADNAPSTLVSPKDVTRRVIVVWKAEPFYTESAREHGVRGTVTLEAAFGADGYISILRVIRGLEDGLTESAIDAARNVRFFPAEKDGKPVSLKTTLEYSFSLF